MVFGNIRNSKIFVFLVFFLSINLINGFKPDKKDSKENQMNPRKNKDLSNYDKVCKIEDKCRECTFEEFLGSLYNKLLNNDDNPNINEEHSLIFLEFVKVKSNEKIIESIAMSLSIEEREKWLSISDTDWGRLQIFQKIGMEVSQ